VKRVGNLWPEVVGFSNLLEAHRLARRGKRSRGEVARFERELEKELLGLQRELVEGSYRHGPYRLRTIQEPKSRVIASSPYRDRVVHHALCRVIEPVLTRGFIHDTYACLPGRGTHRCLDRYRYYSRRYPFVLTCDVRHFFPSIEHGTLLELIARRIKDRRVLGLCEEIIGSFESGDPVAYAPGDDLWSTCERRAGLPIGNLTSQLFANVMLDPLDHFIKEELRLGGYVRYCDDFCCFGPDKEELWEAREAVRQKLHGLRLRIHERKSVVRRTSEAVRFLGFELRSDGRTRVAGAGLRRFRRRLRRQRAAVAAGRLSPERLAAGVAGYLAHVGYARSRWLEASIREQVEA
jgi:retron-type reverse transcriptase